MNNLAVIGCGYLGSEVALTWRNRGTHVTATTRTPTRLEALSKIAQKGVLIKGNDEAEFAPLIASNETILISIAAEGPEHWLGLPNFYTITRYNRSVMYAMAVHQLSESLVQARGLD